MQRDRQDDDSRSVQIRGEQMTSKLANDSLRSFTSGLGDPTRDKAATVFHSDRILTDADLLTSYRNSWIARKIVDIPALDALRKGRDWQAKQDQITLIEKEEKRLGLWLKVLECKTKARLFGGAAVIIGTKGNEPYSEPFDFEMVKKGGVPYLTVMTRRELTANELERDPMSEWYSRPKAYTVSGQGDQFIDIHPSRMVIQVGNPHPDPWNAGGLLNGWGDSVLQHVYDAMMNTESTAANIASLVFEANVDSFGIPDLMEKISTKEYETALLNRLTLAAAGKSISKSLVHDSLETYQRHSASFAALPEVMQIFLLMVSGAADIPLTRFLGQSPSGLSSTGEGDMKNYYDRVTAIQTLEIEPAMYRLDEALIRSALGSRPDEIYYTWTPLEQMSEKDQSTIGLQNAQAAEILTRTGLFDVDELRPAVANQMIENGFYPGLADSMSESAPEFDLGADEPPVKPEPTVAADATPRTLYVRRDVKNGQAIIEWAKANGFGETLQPSDLHVTIAYSEALVDWMKAGEAWDDELVIKAGGPRLIERFDGGAVVLLFTNHVLKYRHEDIREIGASWKWPEYQPHIAITYDDPDVDVSKIVAYQGEIILGPEIFEDLNPDWKNEIVTDSDLMSPRRVVKREFA
jgi:phage-related protein (TIGR01555 family)